MQKNSTFLFFIFLVTGSVAISQDIDNESCVLNHWAWAQSIVAEESYGNNDLTLGLDGNLYVVGAFSYGMTLGDSSYQSKGGADLYIIKYNPSGLMLWQRSVGSKGWDEATAVAADVNGNAYFAGVFSDTLVLDGQQIVSDNSSPDIFLAKFDPYGDLVWLKKYGGSGYDRVGGLAIQPNGNIYLTGSFEGAANIGGSLLNSEVNGNSFLLKLNSSGGKTWLKQFGNLPSLAIKIALKSDNSIVMGGSFTDELTIQSSTITGDFNPRGFVAEFAASNGSLKWLKKVNTGNASCMLSALAIDANNSIYVGGSFSDNYNNDAFVLGDSTYIDTGGFIAKLNATGNVGWSKQLSSGMFNYVTDIAIDNDNSVYATGLFTSDIDFAGQTYSAFGGAIIKFASEDGADLKLWGIGDFSYEHVNFIASDSHGRIYCTGSFENSMVLGTNTITVEGGYSDAFVARLDKSQPLLASEPQIAAKHIDFSNISNTGAVISWKNGGGNARMVIMKKMGKANVGKVVDGKLYDDGAGVFGKGSAMGSGQFVVYNGTGESVNIEGLEPNSIYGVAIIEYNHLESCGAIDYQITKTASAMLSTTKQNPALSKFRVYPNPVRDEMNIILTTPHKGERNFQLVDQKGKLVNRFTARVEPGENHLAIDISHHDLMRGTYLLKIEDKSFKNDTFRVIVK